MKAKRPFSWLSFLLLVASNVEVKALEYQPYTLIERRGEVEIRYYPPVQVAQTRLTGRSYRSVLNEGFRTLAAYIFGENEGKRKIAMTSPVIYRPVATQKEEGQSRHEGEMMFVMPQGIATLPRPNDEEVQLRRTEPMTMAHREFGGFLQFAGLKTFERREAELLEWLKNEGIKPKGSVVHLYYTDPFNPVQRYGVAVEIDPAGLNPLRKSR